MRLSVHPAGTHVAVGGVTRTVSVWQFNPAQPAHSVLLYALPGHRGCVNDVHFHPTEPILLSASSDKTLFLGEF